MKRLFLLLALVVMVFVSCSKDKENEKGNLAQQMIGKWMLDQANGNAVPTNEKLVYTIESDTVGYVSASLAGFSESLPRWTNRVPCEVFVSGDTIIMFGNLNKTLSFRAELKVKSVSATEMTAVSEYTVYHNGTPVFDNSGTALWKKVPSEYSMDILGNWEGRATGVAGSVYDDGEPHRWEYFDDGTYIYYSQNPNGEWEPSGSELSEYFVDGTLLCTRWRNSGEGDEECREWWEISSIADGVMNWIALRQREDGSTFTATFQMTKVQQDD